MKTFSKENDYDPQIPAFIYVAMDRYCGAYSNGKFHAWVYGTPLLDGSNESHLNWCYGPPTDASGSDMTCCCFWDKVREDPKSYPIHGLGYTQAAAIKDLIEKLDTAHDTFDLASKIIGAIVTIDYSSAPVVITGETKDGILVRKCLEYFSKQK